MLNVIFLNPMKLFMVYLKLHVQKLFYSNINVFTVIVSYFLLKVYIVGFYGRNNNQKQVPEVISVASLIFSYRTFKYVSRKNLKNFPDYTTVSLLISYPIYVPKIREIKSALSRISRFITCLTSLAFLVFLS